MSHVKNRATAPLQISAEQILLEAFERKEKNLAAKQDTVTDSEELAELRKRKRTEWEEALRRNRLDIRQWMRYAQFELDQKEFERARSIFERALQVDAANVPLWIRYIQSELKARNINHARNLLDRATAIIPRADKIWYTYVGLEETLGNAPGTRQVFERWMKWRPEEAPWMAYINFESRHNNITHARSLYQRYIEAHPSPANWIKWANFEDSHDNPNATRTVYSSAIDAISRAQGVESIPEQLLVEWAEWEARQKEMDRARALFKFGVDNLPPGNASHLRQASIKLEKQFGSATGLESALLSQRRAKYEQDLAKNALNMDTWWAYLSLVETSSTVEDSREIYERAIAAIPPVVLKNDTWRRYIYILLRYAIFEELITKDISRARDVYALASQIIPHQSVTSAKFWRAYAKFEIRHNGIERARKVYGQALGRAGKPKVFRDYIALELQLRNVDRCRLLYEKFIERYPSKAQAWIDFAGLEDELGDLERARAIFELAVAEDLDSPDILWKAYADFEASNEENDRARKVYERLLAQVSKPEIWMSFAMFEVGTGVDEDTEAVDTEAVERARKVFARGDTEFHDDPTARALLYDARLQFEQQYGTEESAAELEAKAPTAVTKRRKLEDGSMEDYLSYQFPDTNDKVSALLANAKKWAQSKSS